MSHLPADLLSLYICYYLLNTAHFEELWLRIVVILALNLIVYTQKVII